MGKGRSVSDTLACTISNMNCDFNFKSTTGQEGREAKAKQEIGDLTKPLSCQTLLNVFFCDVWVRSLVGPVAA